MYSDKATGDRWFDDAVAVLSSSAAANPDTDKNTAGIRSEEVSGNLAKLSRLSRSLYIPHSLVQKAYLQNELHEFSNLTALTHNAGISVEFIKAYSQLPMGQSLLPLLFRPISEYAYACTQTQISGKLRRKIFSHALTNHDNSANASTTIHTLNLFYRIITFVPGTSEQVLAFHTLLLKKYSAPMRMRWLNRGMSLLVPGKTEEAALFFKLQSAESRNILGMSSSVLDEMKNSLTIFAASIAGGPSGIYSNENSFTGTKRPFTDGANVYLPPTVTFFDNPEMNNRAYTALTAQQCGLIKFGSYKCTLEELDSLNPGLFDEIREKYALQLPDIMTRIRSRYGKYVKSIRERGTGEIEVTTHNDRTMILLETPHEKFFFMFPYPYLAKELFSLLESARVSCRIGDQYNGLRRDIKLVSDILWEKSPALEYDPNRISSVGKAALRMLSQIALKNEGKIPLRQGVIEKAETEFSRIFDTVRKQGSTVYDSLAMTAKLYIYIHDTFPIETIMELSHIEELFNSTGIVDIYPEAVANNKPEFFGETFTLERKERIATDADQEIDITAITANASQRHFLEEYIHYGKTKLYSYPEFDCDAGSYRQQFTTVLSRSLPPGEGNTAMRILSKYQKTYKSIKKRFLMLQPQAVEISRKWVTGDELHPDDCFDYFTSIIRKETPDDKVYQTKIINRRDVCAAVLLDASSSTGSTIPGGSIIDIELAAMVLLGHALHFLGDNFGLYSFMSRGRRQVFINTIKEFDDPWNMETMSRIDSVKPAFANRDGAAIRHITHLLSKQPNKTKLLLVLSDGIPADAGYGAKQGDTVTDYGIEDTRKAVIEARKTGIFPYCITIDREAKDYIGYIYGRYSHTIVPRIEALPQQLSRLYQRITR